MPTATTTRPPFTLSESDINDFHDALEEEVPVDHVEEKTLEILSNLSDEELEHAARSSYKYFLKSRSNQKPSETERQFHALAMAKRHLVAEKGSVKSATSKIKATIQFRRDMNVDIMRRCFHEKGDTSEEEELMTLYRTKLQEQMCTSYMHVQGYDVENRALLLGIPRNTCPEDPNWYLPLHIYIMERALACSERKGDGQDRVQVIFDYEGYKSEHAPSLKMSKKAISCLRDHYPERLQNVYLCDAPLIFRAFWVMLRPFIDPHTKTKIVFLTGDDQKKEALGDLIDSKQAMPWMHSQGTRPSHFVRQTFLHEAPFDQAFNED